MKAKRQDPTIRWIHVRDVMVGWVMLNMDSISTIEPAGYGFLLRLYGGSTLLLTKKEAERVIRRVVPESIRP